MSKKKSAEEEVARRAPSPRGLSERQVALVEAMSVYTARTSTLLDMLGLDKTASQIVKAAVNKAQGDRPSRPRGHPPQHHGRSFMKSMAERYDAALLIALHYPNGVNAGSDAETDIYLALERRLRIYSLYARTQYPHSEPAFSFDGYIELIKGIRIGGIEVRTCRSCHSAHPIQPSKMGPPVCPVCWLLKVDVSAARSHFDERIRRRREERQAAAEITGRKLREKSA